MAKTRSASARASAESNRASIARARSARRSSSARVRVSQATAASGIPSRRNRPVTLSTSLSTQTRHAVSRPVTTPRSLTGPLTAAAT